MDFFTQKQQSAVASEVLNQKYSKSQNASYFLSASSSFGRNFGGGLRSQSTLPVLYELFVNCGRYALVHLVVHFDESVGLFEGASLRQVPNAGGIDGVSDVTALSL